MMEKAVAIEGDTQVETSSSKLPADGNQSGSWVAGSLNVTTGNALSVNNKKVELEATMTWTYSGGSSGSPAVALPPVIDVVILKAENTRLKDNGASILLDGDEATGANDASNKITVTASTSLLTTGLN